MQDLESKIQITEQDLEKSRKDFETAGLLLHFGGEIIGMIYYTGFKGGILPLIQNLQYNKSFNPDYTSVIFGLAVYAVSQIPAFFMKGLSKTEEENIALGRKFEAESDMERKKGRKIESWLTRKMSDLHYHFANNYERYERITQGYTLAKRKSQRVLSKIFYEEHILH
jgi:hypothetical protein